MNVKDCCSGFLTIIGFVCGFELFKIAVSSPIVATGFPFPLPSGIWFSALGGTIFGLIFYFITPSVVDNLGSLLPGRIAN